MEINLHKQNARGKRLIWSGKVTENSDSATVTTVITWGQEGGKLQVKTREYSSGLQGRSAFEQAKQEITQAAKEKQQSNGYTEAGLQVSSKLSSKTKRDASPARPKAATAAKSSKAKRDASPKAAKADKTELDAVPLPMLASNWNGEDRDHIWIQPKLDGLRCMVNLATSESFSRSRHPLPCPSVTAEVSKLAALLPAGAWLDGELYKHGANFQAVTRLFRSGNGEGGFYYVYDLIYDAPFSERWALLQRAFANVELEKIKLVPTIETCTDRVEAQQKEFCAQGYEGAMVRDGSCAYERGKRSKSLAKVKTFLQEEYKVVGFEQQKRADKLGAVVLELANGERFNAQPAMTAEQQQEIWDHRDSYLGQIATVKFFETYDSGKPRFPKLLGFRHPHDM